MKDFLHFLCRLAAVLLLSIVSIFIATAVWSSDRLLHPPRRPLQDYHRKILAHPREYGLNITPYTGPSGTPCLLVTPAANGSPAEKSHILREKLTGSGLHLAPWGKVHATIILLHGFTGRKEDHLPITERLCAAGFRCLLVDLPGHGDSPLTNATFGFTENSLITEVWNDANLRFSLPSEPVALFGFSQGGAIALQMAGSPHAPWSAVASLSTFTSLDQPVSNSIPAAAPRFSNLSSFASAACSVGVKCRVGFFPSEIRPLDAARRIHVPTFIAHGDEDELIPFAAGIALFEAVPVDHKVFRPIKGAKHGNILTIGSLNLYSDLCRFYLEVMPPPKSRTIRKGSAQEKI